MNQKRQVFIYITILANPGFSAFMRSGYAVDTESISICPDNNQLESPFTNFKFEKYNRTHSGLSFDIIYHRDIDKNVGGSMMVERWGDGGWIKVPFMLFQNDICNTMLTYFREKWVNFFKNMGVAHPEQCPVPAGNYSMRNLALDVAGTKVPFWSGRFRFTALFQTVDTRRKIFCLIFIINITEKY